MTDVLQNINTHQKTTSKKEFKENYLAKFGLIGFDADSNSIKLDANTTLKRVSKKQRAIFYKRIGDEKKNLKLVENEFFFSQYYKSETQLSQLLDYQKLVEQSMSVEMFFRVFFDTRIILKYSEKYIENLGQYKSYGFFTMPRNDYYSEIKKFKKAEIQLVKNYWKKFVKIEKKKQVQLVLRRLYYSYQRNSEEDQILDLMIAFEAMFLTRENGELSFRLALRVSKFIEQEVEGNDAKFIYHFIKKAYNIRSKIVHGSHLEDKDFKVQGVEYKFHNFIWYLQFILRKSIKKYAAENTNESFDKMIDMIDSSIISSKSINSNNA